MSDALYIGATGMHAQQLSIDVIANNLANVNTNGYKKNRIDFSDLLYRNMAGANSAGNGGNSARLLGMGTAVTDTGKIFTNGEVKKTDGNLDLAIRGQGFFQVTMPDGTFAYTRNGALQVNPNGMLVTADGYPLNPQIQFPSDTTSITIDSTGHVTVSVASDTATVDLGQLQLANFMNPGGLNPVGDNLYTATQKSGDAVSSLPGDNGFGTVAQGFLEASNVNLIEEMVNLVVAQRAYEINSKVVQAADEMQSISNNMRR